jgi:hypothetical protein
VIILLKKELSYPVYGYFLHISAIALPDEFGRHLGEHGA